MRYASVCSGIEADAPRYMALGNSMTTNVMRWLGERIEMVEEAQAFIDLI